MNDRTLNDRAPNNRAVNDGTMSDDVSTRPHRRGVVHLAGWLFADLMLVLFVTSFSSIVLAAPAHPVPPTRSATPSPSPSKSLMPQKPVLVLNPQPFYINVDAAALAANVVTGQVAQNIIDQMNSQLDARGFRNAKAGLIETFGYTPSQGSASRGQAEAASINKIITGGIPSLAGALTQPYWGGGDDNKAEVEVFFFE